MRFKKALCMTTLATLLFPVVQNIEYVDAAEYSIDIVVDTVEIDINDIPEDRCVKVGISLRNNPGMSSIFFPFQKDNRLLLDASSYEAKTEFLSEENLTNDIRFLSFYNENDNELIRDNEYFFYITFKLPENCFIGDYYYVNILNEYSFISETSGNSFLYTLGFRDKDLNRFSYDCFNVTNGGINIISVEQPQTEPPQTEPPQTEPPQTEPPQTSTSLDTSTTIKSTTITTTSITTTTNESTVTTTENTTNSMTSITTTSSASSITTTTTTEASEVTENKNDKSKNNLPFILAILASIGILGGMIGFIIKKSKGNKGK